MHDINTIILKCNVFPSDSAPSDLNNGNIRSYEAETQHLVDAVLGVFKGTR